MTGQVLLEASANGSVISVQSDDLSPDGAHTRLQVGLLWNGGAGLGLVNVGASLADVERAVCPFAATINLTGKVKNQNSFINNIIMKCILINYYRRLIFSRGYPHTWFRFQMSM